VRTTHGSDRCLSRNGSEQRPDPCGNAHGECAPKGAAYSSYHNASATSPRSQAAEKRERDERGSGDKRNQKRSRARSGHQEGMAAPRAKLPADAKAA
jgi:hypothetical protein